MADVHPGYFAAPAPAPGPVLPPVPDRPSRLPLGLLVLAAVLAVVLPVSLLAGSAHDGGAQVWAVEVPASAAAGWGPTRPRDGSGARWLD